MKPGVTLETERLILRCWTRSETDRAFLHFIQSNKVGRRYYPNRLSRAESDSSLERILDPSRPFSWGVVQSKERGQLLGFTGLAEVTQDIPCAPTVEIGWQYSPAVWGRGYATEAAEELVRHGFEDAGLPEIVAFAVHDNAASFAVMDRIGMSKVPDGDFDHPRVPDTHPHLQRHALYRITREEWLQKTHKPMA